MQERRANVSKITLDAIRDAAGSVATAAGHRLVGIFGSYARRDASPHAIDLGVLGAGAAGCDRRDQSIHRSARHERRRRRGSSPRNPVVLMSVARDGIPLFEATGTEFNEFASLAMRRYADTKQFRDAVREDLRR